MANKGCVRPMDFYLNGDRQQVLDCDANLTLLDFLRGNMALKGTKEGCASGDCGACTVLMGECGGPLRAINSCITPLGNAAGRQLFTVEALAKRGVLHPVQQAMVDCHGSQCGFCTPGFVMALTALYENANRCGLRQTSRETVGDAISGNLCRCTGYRPIVEAGTKMQHDAAAQLPLVQKPAPNSAGNAPLCAQLDDGKHQWYQPTTEQELQTLLARYPSATLVAGATDFGLELTQRHKQSQQLISVTAIPELREFRWHGDFLHIGAALPYTDIENHMQTLSVPFSRLLHRLGSRQIRNQGTLGGNIANASPIADTPPVLMAWDAEVEVVDSSGERLWHSLSMFWLAYRKTLLDKGQYIARVRIPRAALARPHYCYKVSKRFEDDISAVLGAFSFSFERGKFAEVRLAYGGVAATPVRATTTEAVLMNRSLDADAIDKACTALHDELQPIGDVRASRHYRLAVAVNLLRRALLELDGTPALEVHHYPAGNAAALYV